MRKSTYKIIFYVLSISLTAFIACKTDCNYPCGEELCYSQTDVKKQINQVISTNLATGFNDLFRERFTDSLSRASFCRDFTHRALFMDDSSGYIFVESVSGYNISHPLHPELEGVSSIGNTDVYGKEIVKQMIDIVKYIGFGFLEYYYANPANQQILRKTTFVKLIPEAMWYAGSGFYHGSVHPYFTNDEMNQEIVRQSVIVMAEGLGAVLDAYAGDSLDEVNLMRDFLQHIRFFDDQSGYYYVIDFKGYNVVQPPNPDWQGTYEYNLQDSRGNYLVRGLIEKAKAGGGFYQYYWINYQTGLEELKTAYTMPIPGKDYLIGSGVYISH